MQASLMMGLTSVEGWARYAGYLLTTLFWLWMLIDALRRREWLWALFILIGHVFTALLYCFMVYAPGWFSGTSGLQSGGSFELIVPFTFSGDTSVFGPNSVAVTLSNSVGSSSP